MSFPESVIRRCSDCHLRSGCKAPVPGEGSFPAQVMLVGQNPGKQEDEQGRPFVGRAGEYLNSLLFQVGIPRESVYITNLVKCLTANNSMPKPNSVQACSKWLDVELGLVQPRIIVAMGAPAISRFLGNGAGTVEHLHGQPVEVNGRVVLPAYHPAAALRNTNLIRQCSEDFQVLRGLVKGRDAFEYHVVDGFPSPDYRVADSREKLELLADRIVAAGEFAVDVETVRQGTEFWSAQFSTEPGTAWFLPAEGANRLDVSRWESHVIVHYYLNDINWLKIPDGNFSDTMTLAYLVGLPQGLKELASRLCGINMVTYAEMVRHGQRELSLDYLTEVGKQEWPDPPEVEESVWDNERGRVVAKVKHPWHISRKVSKIMKDTVASSDTDPYDRWRSIPEVERAVVENVLGPMPESSLADIKFEDAVQYACRDADATLRVYRKLKKLIVDLGLDFVLNMDLGILPMVDEMMRNGMAVDLDHLRNLSAEYDARMRAKATELASMVGHPFNPNSRPQTATVVYEELGFQPTRLTPTGQISTDDQDLKKTGHPVAFGIIECRRLSKMKGTYADNLIRYAILDSSGVPRVHTTLKTTRTETGRLSSAEPLNLQNVPTRSREGKVVRNGFVSPWGWRLLEGDLGQIEMCVQAHLADCRGLIDLFLRGDDPHTVTASQLFGVPYEEARKEKYRYPTKRANFGIIYLIGAKGLSDQIMEYIADLEMEGEPVEVDPWSVEDCERFIRDWYKLYPEVRDYQMEKAAEARRYGYVRDMFGRIRFIPEVSCPVRSIQETGFKMAANMPVQAGAQGIIKLAMGRLWREWPDTPWTDARILLQIHDSLLFEVPDDGEYIRDFSSWVRGVMAGVVSLKVPVKVDFKSGYRWGELEPLG